MSDFLLELRSEEIPARMQAGARAALDKAFREHLAAAGVSHGAVTVWSTPRRLALIARALPQATEAQREDIKGPKVGAPPQALEGFLRKVGLPQEKLEERDGTYFAIVERPARATRDVLAWAIAAIVKTLPWPKAMRWGAASLSSESPRWVRPLSGIVAILGDELVACTAAGVSSGYATLGHRFHCPGPITIGGANDYAEKLRACRVIVDHAEREALIRDHARAAAVRAGLTLVEDEGLVIENAGLTEWPVPLLGRFDAAFLEVPPEVIQLTARTNQKYFVCNDGAGRLANAFVCTANIEAADGGAAIIDGNRKVLAARLSDARFFWEQDRRKTLEERRQKLSNIVFHERLGSVADKVERVARLARWLVEAGIVKPSPLQGRARSGEAAEGVGAVERPLRLPDSPHPNPSPEGEGLSIARLADWAEQAARLCKADLVTEMVGEFPELQGLMGGYYARAEGLPEQVADAIRDHYKPVGQGDEVPTAPVTVAVSLADKLDTLCSFFGIDERPTGSKDPFALRRAALGVIALTIGNGLRLPIAAVAMRHALPSGPVPVGIVEFFADRLKVQQREAGVRHDLIDAVFAARNQDGAGEDDLVRLLARVHALQAFVATPDGTNLLAGYKRAANILKKEGYQHPSVRVERSRDPSCQPVSTSLDTNGGKKKEGYQGEENTILSYTPEPAEAALIEALDAAEPRARDAIAAEDFTAAMGALASLRGPIDAFFDAVTVNHEDPVKRAARLTLLARFRNAVHQAADFSKIEG